MMRRIEHKKHRNCRIVCGAVMVLVAFATCKAGWVYLGSELSSGPNYGYYKEPIGGWEFFVYNYSRSAGPGGASVQAYCTANSWLLFNIGPGSMRRYYIASCGTYGKSYYFNPGDPSVPLYLDWSISGSGSVFCAGLAYDWCCLGTGSVSVSNLTATGIQSGQKGGWAYAWGSASGVFSDGIADADVFGYASVQELDGGIGSGTYYAELDFTVEGSGDDEPFYGTQYEAVAKIWAYSDSYGSVTVSEGEGGAYADSEASFSGISSVQVSW